MEKLENEMGLFEEEIDIEDLFNGQNTIDMENENYIIVEDDGKMIIPVKPSTPFEELHCEKYDKYLVPIFIDKYDKMSFNGNGVIVDNYLITAAHVAICNKCKRNISKLY